MRVGSGKSRGFAGGHIGGFSLVELLVVMTIIAVLAAIVFPVLVKAKQTADISECLSNMKQMGSALNMYLNEYDGRFPAAVPWGIPGSAEVGSDKTIQELLSPFVRDGMIRQKVGTRFLYPKPSVFTCPSDTGLLQKHDGFCGVRAGARVWLQTGCSYEYYATNQRKYLDRDIDSRPLLVPWTALSPQIQVGSKRERVGAPVSMIVHVTKKAVMGDIWFWHLGDQVPPDDEVAFCNTLFADGHAARVKGTSHCMARVEQLQHWHSYQEIDY